MKTIEIERFMEKKEFFAVNEHPDQVHDLMNKGGEGRIKVKLVYEYEPYHLKIRKGLNGQHLVNDSEEGRLPFGDFMKLLSELKKGGCCEVAWDIYPGQPVWEFKWEPGSLAHKIKQYNPLIEVSYE